MTRHTVLFTIAMLLSFMSTQVIHTSGAELPSSATVSSKSKGKSGKKGARTSKKHKSESKSHANSARKQQDSH
jgi:hypothetical protein